VLGERQVACWQVNTACWSRESQLCPAGVPGVPRRVVQARDAAGMAAHRPPHRAGEATV